MCKDRHDLIIPSLIEDVVNEDLGGAIVGFGLKHHFPIGSCDLRRSRGRRSYCDYDEEIIN